MDNTNILYNIAEKNNIVIDSFRMKAVKAFSMPNIIVLNPNLVKTSQETRECIAHELGHHMRNAFYNIESTFETRERQEERATRWAVQELIPVHELKKAIKNGYTEIWQLADYFDVSYEFMVEAIRIHKVKGTL